MPFGFYNQLLCASGFTQWQRYHDIIPQIELGDVLGFHTAWLGELHFSRAFSILADPMMVLAAAQRSERIRLRNNRIDALFAVLCSKLSGTDISFSAETLGH